LTLAAFSEQTKSTLFTSLTLFLVFVSLPEIRVFSQSSDFLLEFSFGRVIYRASWTYWIAACAGYHARIRFFYNRSFLAVLFLGCKYFHVAKVHTFAASNAFFIVYGWVPRYFASGNSVPRLFFRHFECLFIPHQYS
jgi:hypothetical protein